MSNFFIPEMRAVFIHIPKTGGTSIRKGIFKDVEGPIYNGFKPEWEALLKFAFVREPIDRFLSCVSMFQGGTADLDGAIRRAGNQKFTLEYSLNLLGDDSLDYGVNRKTPEERFLHHALPMTHPFNNLSAADFVGRYESFEHDLRRLFEIQKVHYQGDIPILHRSISALSTATLTAHQLEQLVDYYREDYALGFYKPPKN